MHPHIHFTLVAPGRIFTNISYNALKNDGNKHQTLDEGQVKGIKAKICAARILKAVRQNQRKVYIVQQERILLFLHRFFPSLFVSLVKKLGLK
jgi:short-subunit dehydrogenase